MDNNDMIGTLKGLLGDNAEEKIGMVMNALQGGGEKTVNVEDDISVGTNVQDAPMSLPFGNSGDASQYLMRIKGLIDEMGNANDSRSNLLMSLRPYMRDNRKKSIDNMVKILNLSKISGLFR